MLPVLLLLLGVVVDPLGVEEAGASPQRRLRRRSDAVGALFSLLIMVGVGGTSKAPCFLCGLRNSSSRGWNIFWRDAFYPHGAKE